MNQEEKYIEIREKLRNLPKIQASEDFIGGLNRKISQIESPPAARRIELEKTEEAGFFAGLFGKQNPWLAPAIGFGIVLIIAGIFYFSSGKDDIVITEKETAGDSVQNETALKNGTGNDNAKDLTPMQKEKVSEEMAANTDEGTSSLDENVSEPESPSTDRTVTESPAPETRVRPEIKKEAVEETKETEEKINSNFKNSALEKMEAKSRNEGEITLKKKSDTSSAKSKKSPIQVSTIKKVELESLKEKVSDQ